MTGQNFFFLSFPRANLLYFFQFKGAFKQKKKLKEKKLVLVSQNKSFRGPYVVHFCCFRGKAAMRSNRVNAKLRNTQTVVTHISIKLYRHTITIAISPPLNSFWTPALRVTLLSKVPNPPEPWIPQSFIINVISFDLSLFHWIGASVVRQTNVQRKGNRERKIEKKKKMEERNSR